MLSAPLLEPQVKGRLADTEATIIKLIAEGGDTWRTTISMDATIALAAVRAADREKRDYSNFIAVVVTEYLNAHAVPTAAIAEILEKTGVALNDDPELGERILELLTTSRRRRRAPAAAR